MSRVRVKVCGITCKEDALLAIEAGADALGFNAWPGSKRYLNLREAAGWISDLPPLVSRVVVLVNPTEVEVREVMALPWIDAIQLHGTESPGFCRALAETGVQVIKALPAAPLRDGAASGEYGTRRILLDAWTPQAFGGSGKLLDLEFTRHFLRSYPGFEVIIAGGLTAANVAMVAGELRPYAVDVASGVEIEGNPRRKDPTKLLQFFRALCTMAPVE